jgi:hypothetical protein
MQPEAERLLRLARSAGFSGKHSLGAWRSPESDHRFVENVFVYARLAQRKLAAPSASRRVAAGAPPALA